MWNLTNYIYIHKIQNTYTSGYTMQCIWNKSTHICLSCKLWITVLDTLFGLGEWQSRHNRGSLVGTSKYIISFQSHKTQLYNPQKNLSHPQQFIQITLWYRTWYTFFLSYFMSPLICHHYHHHNKCSLMSPDKHCCHYPRGSLCERNQAAASSCCS